MNRHMRWIGKISTGVLGLALLSLLPTPVSGQTPGESLYKTKYAGLSWSDGKGETAVGKAKHHSASEPSGDPRSRIL